MPVTDLSRRPAHLRGVIFDMDGVIVDSEPLSLLTIAEVIAERGGQTDPASFGDLVGRSLDDALRLAAARSGRDLAVNDLRRAYDKRYLPKLRDTAVPNAGLRELMAILSETGIPMALASSSRLAEIGAIVTALGLGNVLAAIASGEEVSRPKPAPDVYLLAMRRLGLGPAGVIAIEDSASGVAAAIAAGLACVAVRTMLTTGHDHGAAALTVDSLTELDLQVLDRIAARGKRGSAVAGGPVPDSRARTGLSPPGSASFDDGVASAGH
jgi:HAD superfamily hydrolase (TIGR01509 family)